MENRKIDRHTALYFKNGKAMRNRVVVPPMASQTATESGQVSAATLAHYERLASSCGGLLIVEYSYVHLSGRSETNQLGIDQDAQIDGLTQLANLIQSSGALAGIQITHAGGKTERALTGGVLHGPAGIRVPVKDRFLEEPTPMTPADIELWKSSFQNSISRAVQAGFDLVEIHAAHGYGINQWLSPITNPRGDGLDLLVEIVAEAKRRFPKLLLSVRMPGQDFIEGGLQVHNSLKIALALEQTGADILHISSGIGGWKRPGTRSGEGYLVVEAAEIQKVVSIPVIGVGGIESGKYIDESLRQKRFSLAAVGRAILNEPKLWGKQQLCTG